jgi:hypothetical protein
VLDAFDDDRTNVLFVGRMIPNKRPDQLIRFFHAYQSIVNPDAGCCWPDRPCSSRTIAPRCSTWRPNSV